MAVKVLCLANDGPGGRKRGAIIHIQEGPSLDEIPLGKKCRPPTFFVIGLADKYLADLPNDWLQYGGRRSRILIEADKLDLPVIAALGHSSCCSLALETVQAVQKDQGPDWMLPPVLSKR